jgi:murein DD-endopeptidase MepM/ murein hydrolase activator NlpD
MPADSIMMCRTRRALLLGAVLALATGRPTEASAQTPADSAKPAARRVEDSTLVHLTPARPRQGTIVRVTVRPGAAVPTAQPVGDSLVSSRRDSLAVRPDNAAPDTTVADSIRGRVVAIQGALFGEPLHFTAADSGTYTAIGGIPVDAPRSVRLPLVIVRAGMPPDTQLVQLDIARTAYTMEKLTVAPKFGQAPDSALAARMAREQALAANVSRRSHGTPKLWTGAFARPRPSRVTSKFGDGREFNGAVQSRHMGLDLAGVVGAPVVAPDRGVVALVGDFYLAGNVVYIDHGAGLVTAYFHLSAVNVAQGDTVSAGDTIGKVGATGRVTGPHLHWVARYGAVTVDPSSLLDLAPARREP